MRQTTTSISIHGVRKFWIYWTLHLLSCFKDFHNNCMDNGLLTGFTKKHFETWTPDNFIRFTKWSPNSSMVILIIVIPWTFLHYFLKQGRKYMNNRWNWTIGRVYGIFKIFPSRYPSQGTQATQTQETKKVWTLQPKPSHARGAEHEEQLEEQHRQGAGVQPYPVIT